MNVDSKHVSPSPRLQRLSDVAREVESAGVVAFLLDLALEHVLCFGDNDGFDVNTGSA